MNEPVDTVLIVHASREWRTFHRRQMLLALAEVLPKHVALLCVNRPITLDVTLWKHPRKFWGRAATYQDGRLQVLTPRLLLHDIIAAKIPGAPQANALLLRRVLQGHLRRHYPNIRRMIQWIYHPVQRWVFEALPDTGRIYECYDEYSRTSDGHVISSMWNNEQVLLRTADLAFATTETLATPRRDSARRLALLPNGVPDFFFETPVLPCNLLDNVSRPRVGYLGNARPPLDFPLLETVFRERPDWQLVFAGPVESRAFQGFLRALSNAHFLGPQPLEVVPRRLRALDVGLIPFRINESSLALKPLKLGEHLSAGLPIVAAELPELMTPKEPVITAPNDTAATAAAIERALMIDRASYASRAVDRARPMSWTAIANHFVLPELQAAFEF